MLKDIIQKYKVHFYLIFGALVVVALASATSFGVAKSITKSVGYESTVAQPYQMYTPTSTQIATSTKWVGNLNPAVNNNYDLGVYGLAWRNIMTSGTVTAGYFVGNGSQLSGVSSVNDWGTYATSFGENMLTTSSTYPVWIRGNLAASGTIYATSLSAQTISIARNVVEPLYVGNGTSTTTIYGSTGSNFPSNVGIGTSTPLSRLVVVGANSLTDSAFLVASSTDGSPLLQVKNKNGDIAFGPSSGYLYEASSTISYIGGLNTGNITFPDDAGQVMALDMGLTSLPAFTEASYSFGIGGYNLLKLSNFMNTAGVMSTTNTIIGWNFNTANTWGDTTGIYEGNDVNWQGGTITTTNNTTTTLIAIPFSGTTSTIMIDCTIANAGTTSSAKAASYQILGGVAKLQGAAAVVLGTPTVNSYETANNTDSDVFITAGGGQANVVVSGPASNSMAWKGSCKVSPINQ